MKLSIIEMTSLKRVLAQTGETNPDNTPVMRRFSGTDMSAYNWFVKNSEGFVTAYDEKLKAARKAIEEKYKKDLEKEKTTLAAITKMVNKSKEGDPSKALLALVKQFIVANSVRGEMDKDLNEDEVLLKAVKEEKHEVEVKDKTLELIKKSLEDYSFTAGDTVLADVIDTVNG